MMKPKNILFLFLTLFLFFNSEFSAAQSIEMEEMQLRDQIFIFTSFYQFVKNEDGKWLLISDMPYTEVK